MELLFIYNNGSFGFLYGLYSPLLRLNVISKNSTSFELVLMPELMPHIFKHFDDVLACAVYLLPIHITRNL